MPSFSPLSHFAPFPLPFALAAREILLQKEVKAAGEANRFSRATDYWLLYP